MIDQVDSHRIAFCQVYCCTPLGATFTSTSSGSFPLPFSDFSDSFSSFDFLDSPFISPVLSISILSSASASDHWTCSESEATEFEFLDPTHQEITQALIVIGMWVGEDCPLQSGNTRRDLVGSGRNESFEGVVKMPILILTVAQEETSLSGNSVAV